MTVPMTILAERALEIARGELGVRELRRNRGPEVDMYVSEGGGLDPEMAVPWCASFVSWCILRAAAGRPVGFKRGASVLKLYSRNPTLRQSTAAPGTVFLDFHTTTNGHCGFVVDVMPDGRLRTLEGNTGPGPAAPAKDREGDGVFERFDRRQEGIESYLVIA